MKLRMFIIMLYLMGLPGTLFADTPQFISEYTSLTECKVLERPGKPDSGGPNDHYLAQCPGRDGYVVYNESGDVRGWLVIKKGKQVVDLQGVAEGDIGFPVLGGVKLEWRYRVSGGKKKLAALIFRMSGNDREAYDRGDYHKTASFLYAVRLTPDNYCVVGKARTNEEAHQLSDDDQKPQYCHRYDGSQ